MLGRYVISLSALALLLNAGDLQAAPKAKGKPAPAAKAKKGKDADKEKEREKEKDAEKEKEQPTEAEKAEAAAADAKSASKEDGVKAAGTAAPKSSGETSAVKVKEDKEGVKTYKFETVEVEGRLKSPQVIYFLRRVRAEFEAGALGHRSFLGELSDSRRSAAFR